MKVSSFVMNFLPVEIVKNSHKNL